MHALKVERLPFTEREADKIIEILRDFATSIGYQQDRIDSLDCRRRDGFIPFSHNHGGLECVSFTSQYHLQFEGTGFENADKTLEKYREYDKGYFVESNPEVPKDEAKWTESHYEMFDEYRQNDDEATVLFSLDIMHQGIDDDGTQCINLRFCVCVQDAPYHRQFDDKIDIDIEFKTLAELKARLDKVLKQNDIGMFIDLVEDAF